MTGRGGLRANLAGLRPIRGLLVAVTVSRCSVMLYPFYAAYLSVTRQGMSAGAIGLVIGTFGVGALLADVVSGALTRRFAERGVAVAGLVGVAVVVCTISATDTVAALAAETALWGFCYELVNPIAYTLVARAVPESARRFAFAAVRLAINVGMGTGPVIAGLLFHVRPGLLVWGTAIGYVIAAVVLIRAGGTTTPSEAPPESTSDAEASGAARHEMRFWAFFASILPVHIAYALPPTVISVYVIHQLGRSPGWVSAVFALNAILVITCEIGLNHLMSGWRRRSTLLAGNAAAAVGFTLMGLGGRSPWFLLAATAVWTLGEMIIYPSMLDHISAISPDHLKARNMGFYSGGMNLGVLVAPLLFLPLSSVLPGALCWALVGLLLVAGLVAVAMLSATQRTWGVDAAPEPPPVLANAER